MAVPSAPPHDPLLDAVRPPAGLFRCAVLHRGRVIQEIEESNLVVAASKPALAALIGALDPNSQVTQFGVGSNGTAPDAGNTGLSTPFLKPLGAFTYPAPGQVQWAFSLLGSEANGMAVSEFGLLTAGGTLFARKVRASPLVKTADLSLSGTWLISF